MSIFKKLLSVFGRKKEPDEVSMLNSSCNTTFEKIFLKCRSQLGNELIEIMNIKRSIVDAANSQYTSQLLVKKILSLIYSYLNLAGSYVDSINSLNKPESCDPTVLDAVKANKEKLDQIHSLIKSLSLKLSLNATEAEMECDLEETINEALALNNVLTQNMRRRI